MKLSRIFWTLIAILDIIGLTFFYRISHAQAPSQLVNDCPAGYYVIDESTCKAEPTGCPYGDSIPLDSPKCAPSENDDQSEAVMYNSIEPTAEQAIVGK